MVTIKLLLAGPIGGPRRVFKISRSQLSQLDLQFALINSSCSNRAVNNPNETVKLLSLLEDVKYISNYQ